MKHFFAKVFQKAKIEPCNLTTFVGMKELFRKYRSVLRFLLLFLGTYLVLGFLYGGYLQFSKGPTPHPDFVTQKVATQSETLLNEWGYASQVVAHDHPPSMQLGVEGTIVGSIVEGCNSLSVIILFVAFVVAFFQKWQKTLVFVLAGAVLIYAINLLRIAVLAVALYEYPEYQEVLHTVVFPGIIYGFVFLLWVVWVRSIPKSKSNG
ncbi:MAG TPA: exosortase family protein XrtF [Flavobacteriaceae bacterium]|nr:exosortase family protein XrtF [Flavobacteriaceae bacterium]HQU22118.1 exosortase family protein XrtF [Flavobacteriaceae bacterium]HQU64276.1 exosortase family protein XrtF [Flavobacteriaceae bacterium]HRW44287.1 exosortase family protein XrtF [Flavobacteriaceae bacterium]